MVGVYDGESVGLGRIVVDSTWHHWFSYNLHGLRTLSPAYYAAMQDYYRNVALWLATPAQRAAMLFAATWGTLVGSQPGAFDRSFGIQGLGRRVVDVIGRAAPQCILDELVATAARLPRRRRRPSVDDRAWMWVTSPDVLNVSIVGGIADRLLDLAHTHINERSRKTTDVDVDAIRDLPGRPRGGPGFSAVAGVGLSREQAPERADSPIRPVASGPSGETAVRHPAQDGETPRA
jgi:hypothetical protein